jgi:hypothetical protein
VFLPVTVIHMRAVPEIYIDLVFYDQHLHGFSRDSVQQHQRLFVNVIVGATAHTYSAERHLYRCKKNRSGRQVHTAKSRKI